MNTPKIKQIVKLSWIYETAKKELEVMNNHPDIDADFISIDGLVEYVKMIIESHKNEWLVIDDTNDEGVV